MSQRFCWLFVEAVEANNISIFQANDVSMDFRVSWFLLNEHFCNFLWVFYQILGKNGQKIIHFTNLFADSLQKLQISAEKPFAQITNLSQMPEITDQIYGRVKDEISILDCSLFLFCNLCIVHDDTFTKIGNL